MKVIYAYRYGIVGGVSSQLLLRQAAMAEVGIECHLFFSQDNGLRDMPCNGGRVYYGCDISLRKLVLRVKPDVVLVVDSPELLREARGGFWGRIPVFLDVHTTTHNGLAYLSHLSVNMLSGICVPTKYSAGLVSGKVASCAPSVVPNLLNTDDFFRRSQEHMSEPAVREFIWVGKLDNHKNWQLAIIYAALAKSILGTIRLTIVGGFTAPKARAKELFELILRMDVANEVRWIDRIGNAELGDLYRNCALSGGAMLVSSRDESFGMAAAEALLCGCPLIANDLPVFREVFPDSSQVQRVDVWNLEEVANAFKRVEMGADAEKIEQMSLYLQKQYGKTKFIRAFRAAVEGVL
ncbi:glycosyltransferase [Microbulbifer magnicolonia]|uniref:glycosyltransferase family 4 protein n=1 Tax=Microbulbifer magnicolonia TaxID=3109744 RepID=UPI002B402D8E|nr:glycosyltransferase [Microbulbifer sp. GG15]